MNDSGAAEAKQLYADGEEAFAQGSYGRALDLFAEVIIHPGADASTMPALHWNMALCQGHLGNLRAALEQASAGGNTEPSCVRYWLSAA